MFDKKACKLSAKREGEMESNYTKNWFFQQEAAGIMNDDQIKNQMENLINTTRGVMEFFFPIMLRNYDNYHTYIVWKVMLRNIICLYQEKYGAEEGPYGIKNC
jgi:hypothetical protein